MYPSSQKPYPGQVSRLRWHLKYPFNLLSLFIYFLQDSLMRQGSDCYGPRQSSVSSTHVYIFPNSRTASTNHTAIPHPNQMICGHAQKCAAILFVFHTTQRQDRGARLCQAKLSHLMRLGAIPRFVLHATARYVCLLQWPLIGTDLGWQGLLHVLLDTSNQVGLQLFVQWPKAFFVLWGVPLFKVRPVVKPNNTPTQSLCYCWLHLQWQLRSWSKCDAFSSMYNFPLLSWRKECWGKKQMVVHLPAYLVFIGRFSGAGSHEWMPFVTFCARSHERLQLSLLGRFLSRCWFTLCITMQV